MQDDLEYLEYKIEYIEYFSLDGQTGLVVSSMLSMCQLHIKISNWKSTFSFLMISGVIKVN